MPIDPETDKKIDDYFEQDLEAIFYDYLLYLTALKEGAIDSKGKNTSQIPFPNSQNLPLNLGSFRYRLKTIRKTDASTLQQTFGIYYSPRSEEQILLIDPKRVPEKCREFFPHFDFNTFKPIVRPKPNSVEPVKKPVTVDFSLSDVFYACIRQLKQSKIIYNLTEQLDTIDSKRFISKTDIEEAFKNDFFTLEQFNELASQVNEHVSNKIQPLTETPKTLEEFMESFRIKARHASERWTREETQTLKKHGLLNALNKN